MTKPKPGPKRPQSPDFDPTQLQNAGSLHDVIKRYLDNLVMRNYSPVTVGNKKHELMLWTMWCNERGLFLAADITRRHMERYQVYLFHYRKVNGKPLGFMTQRDRLTMIRVFYSWAVRKHFVPANPASDLDMPRPVKTLPHFLTLEEVAAVMAVPDITQPEGIRDRTIFETFYSTGIRRAELSRLCVDDIDQSAGLVRIIQGKGHKDRLIPIGERALVWVNRYLEEARPLWPLPIGERILFVCEKTGGGLSVHQVGRAVSKALLAAGIPKHGSCHLFRHTMATQLLNAGCDMRYIKDMLGHVKMDTTAHYTQVAVERLKAMHATFHPAET